nr:24 kDa excretory/secretory protein [Haemonchus contortus]
MSWTLVANGEAKNRLGGNAPKAARMLKMVVWQWSKKVGCAVEWSKDMTLVGYEYAQAGNFLGSLIYETGEPFQRVEAILDAYIKFEARERSANHRKVPILKQGHIINRE